MAAATLLSLAMTGVITALAEVPLQGPIPFESFDLNGDGRISEQELDQVREQRVEARRQAGMPAMLNARPFNTLDADGDGGISPAELQAQRGGPGAGIGFGPGGGPPSFAEFDLDGNGAITEAELNEARANRIAARAKEGRQMRGLAHIQQFSDLDSNGDGVLSEDEFTAGVRRHRQQMQQGRGWENNPPSPR